MTTYKRNTSTQFTPNQIHVSPKVNRSLTYVLFNLLGLLSAMGDCIFQNGHTYSPPHKLLFQCDRCLLLQPELGLYSLPLNLSRDYWLPPPMEYSTSEVMWLGGQVQPEMWIKSPQMIPVPSFNPSSWALRYHGSEISCPSCAMSEFMIHKNNERK